MTRCECDAAIVSRQLKSSRISRIIEVCILDRTECERECDDKEPCCEGATYGMPDLRVIIGSRNKPEKCLYIELKFCVKRKAKSIKSQTGVLGLLNDIDYKMRNAMSCPENLPTKRYAVFSEDLRNLRILRDLHEQSGYSFSLVFGLEELKKKIMRGDC